MRLHPLLYLGLILILVVFMNLFLLKSGLKMSDVRMREPKYLLKTVSVKKNHLSENTILSRIQYPDRSKALLLGRTPHALDLSNNNGFVRVGDEFMARKTRLTIGIASMARKKVSRKPKTDYLESTLHWIFEKTSKTEQEQMSIVVSLTDRNRSLVAARAARLNQLFEPELKSGLMQVIAPSENIYPDLNFTAEDHSQGHFRTYSNAPKASEWRSKLTLDFAFLFSYSQDLSEYFLNMEDDVIPEQNFVNKTLEIVEEYNKKGLVSFMLTSFRSQPADFLMQYFDLLQLADRYNPNAFRVAKPLFTHVGEISTKDEYQEEDERNAEKKYLKFKEANPPARLFTTIQTHGHRAIASAYKPREKGAFFWGKEVKTGDVIDLVLETPVAKIDQFLLVSGFSPSEHRTPDELLDADLLVAEEFLAISDDGLQAICKKWRLVEALPKQNSMLRAENISIRPSEKQIKCLRIRVKKTSTDWLTIKLISLRVSGETTPATHTVSMRTI